jgi:uncharacterized membrane protein YdbT with pleckstrin-like domain
MTELLTRLSQALEAGPTLAALFAVTGFTQRFIDWNQNSRTAAWLKRAAAVLLILIALRLIYTA